MLFWLCCIVLLSGGLFGGGTHAGYLGDCAAQLLAIPLLVTALWPALSTHSLDRHKARIALGLFCAIALIAFIQVLPLPFNAGHGSALLPSPAQGQEPEPQHWAWAALSLAPQATWAAAVSLIVPLAVFAAVMQLGFQQRLTLCWLLLGLGGLSLFLGFAQVAQGPQSELRFFDFTNPDDAVGLFANRNHFAAHLYVTLALAAVWFQVTAESTLERGKLGTKSTFLFAAAAVFVVAVVAGLAFSRSRAGIILAVAALAGIVFIALTQSRTFGGERQRSSRRAMIAVMGFATLFTALFGLGRAITRFEVNQGQEIRGTLTQTTLETALKTLPFGTGLGSFVPVYATVEKSEDMFDGYANRAHNDLAELLLETGLPGAVSLLAFLVWFVRRSRAVWLAGKADGDPLRAMLEKTATLVIALLLVHSLGDYPLRTTALSVVFAFFCAILASPASAPLSFEKRPRQHGHAPAPIVPHRANAPVPAEKWGGHVSWPQSWQRSEDDIER